MNILITGANGQLGNEMRVLSAQHTQHTYFFTDIAELDITSREAVNQFVTDNAIDVIVNCAAYTNVAGKFWFMGLTLEQCLLSIASK